MRRLHTTFDLIFFIKVPCLRMWTEMELARCGKTFINGENTLEAFCLPADLGLDKTITLDSSNLL